MLGVIAEGEALSAVNHDGVKGRLREVLVKSAIEPFLPSSVVVRTGIILPRAGTRVIRNQDDVVIFHNEASPLLDDVEPALILLDGVLCHIEVKSKLTRD